MRRLSVVFHLALALGVVACEDAQHSALPSAPDRGRATWDKTPGSTTLIYSNFGPGMTFGGPFAWGIKGPGFPSGEQAVSQQFSTTAGAYALAQAKVALSRAPGAHIRVIVQADSSGKPGPFVEEMSFDPIASTPSIYVANSILAPVLHDTLYWLTVAEADTGLLATWNWNSIGDVSTTNFASTVNAGPKGPWVVFPGLTRGAFEIDGRLVPSSGGGVVHQASAGGTVLWGTEKVTYGITAQQMADGSITGHLLWLRHSDHFEYQGTVTCLTVIGNRAYLSGDVTRPDEQHAPYFAIALEDNGEGARADVLDRVSSLYPQWTAPRCGQAFPVPVAEWTHGNVQVK